MKINKIKAYLRLNKSTPSSLEHPRSELLSILPKHSVGAEIGVWKGEFSDQIVKIVVPQKLYLIDPWEFIPTYNNRWYGGKLAKSQSDMDVIYSSVVKKFEVNNNVKILRGLSNRIVGTFEEDYFDWIYIDGNHSYEFVYQDLLLYYEKVKPGGLITGDDLNWESPENPGIYPVKDAVNSFLKKKPKLQLITMLDQFVIPKV